MRLVVQRVSRAAVKVENKSIGEVEKGLLILLGIGPSDTDAMIDFFIEKIINLRIFDDADGKMNNSLVDIGGQLLVVSQFTLYADCRKGRRPGFTEAANPEIGLAMYKKFIQQCRAKGIKTEEGKFGEHMLVDFVNDGPVTIILDSKDFSF